MKTIYHTITAVIFSCIFSLLPLHAQEKREIELTAQEILARVDRILDYPQGLIRGKMVHITPDGRSKVIELVGSITEDDYLFKFISKILNRVNIKSFFIYFIFRY